MPLDHPLGHNYGPTNIVGEASAHLGDIHHRE